jgi:amino acid adenylation domain-containing protein/FkbH-like protein
MSRTPKLHLTPKKQALLRQLMQRQGLARSSAPRIPARDDRSRAPLSYAQRGVWLIHELEPEAAAYNDHFAFRLRGRINVAALQQGLQAVVERHETLRTTFKTIDEQPTQIISPRLRAAIRLIDADGLGGSVAQKLSMVLASAEARRAFDLEAGPLWQMALVRLSGEDSLLVFTIHHLVSDGWSHGVLLAELTVLYEAFGGGLPAALPGLAIQYGDFALWQKEWVEKSVLAEQLLYWKAKLAGSRPALDLPLDHPRPAAQSFNGARQPLVLTAELERQLRGLSQQFASTLFMVLATAFKALLYRYTGERDILIGTPVAGRSSVETESLIGFFVNMVALRTEVSGTLTFVELHERVRETALAAFAHQDLPFERLVEELNPNRGLSRNPLFQAVFSFQNEPPRDLSLGGLSLRRLDIDAGTAKFDLILAIGDSGERLSGNLEYSTDLFDAATIRRATGHLLNLLNGIVSRPAARLCDLPLLAAAESHQIEIEWNATTAFYEDSCSIHHLFEEQVGRAGEAIAIVYQHEHLSYATLNHCADFLASRLRRLTTGPEPRVGVCLRRRPAMVVALLGVLKAGAAYVPMEPSLPAERLRLMARDAAAEVVVSEGEWAAVFGGRSEVIEADGSWMTAAAGEVHTGEAGEATEAVEEVRQTAGPQSLLYVIYTSGSSGQPKGVEVSHGGMLNLVRWHQTAFGISASDRATQVAGLGFDACGWELWPYLTAGAAVEVVPDEVRLSGEGMRQWLVRRAITISFLPTPLAERVLAGRWGSVAGLRVLLTGGDQLKSRGVVGQGFALVNNYGPTEDSVVATSGVVEAAEGERRAPGIGRPIANTEVYVVDGQGEALGVGVAGELYIGGAGLARGYAGSAGQTAEKFVPDGLSGRAGGRLYRSGDVVRWSGDGRLEFNGRRDEQVKVRGYRIELGEIEAVMMGHAEVRECAVRVWEGAEREKRLVCYVVGSGAGAVEGAELREYLRGKLPDYMVPSAFVALKEMPLTANGKLDRKRLPEPLIEATDAGRPHTAIEEILIGIYAEMLRREPVRVSESFFELGGHSLLATQVVSRIREVLQVDLPLRELFEHPTVAELAAVIERERGSGRSAAAPPIVRVSRDGELPLSYAQQRLWFVQQLDPASAAYNIASAVRLHGRLCPHALQQSLGELARRHDILRTRLATCDGRPVPLIEQPQPQPLPLWDLSRLRPTDRQQQARALAAAEGARLFDLELGPVWRAALVGCGEREQELLLTLHHVAGDGWSMGVMVKEVTRLYSSNREGVESGLEDLEVQYVDYAAWQREWLSGEVLEEQLGYWRQQLAGLAGLDLPTDRPRTSADGRQATLQGLALSAGLCEKLSALSRREGVTPFMILLAGFQLLLSRYTGQTDIAIGTPISGRSRAETEPLIGFFINTLVLRTDLSGNPSLRELLQRVRQTALDAYAHQDLPFEKLVEELQPDRDLYRSPFFEILFNYINAPAPAARSTDVTIERVDLTEAESKYPMTLYVRDDGGQIRLQMAYQQDLFSSERIVALLDQYRELLSQIVERPEGAIASYSLITERSRPMLPDPCQPLSEPRYAPVTDMFNTWAVSSPRQVAVTQAGKEWSYEELSRSAQHIAGALLGRGLKPGQVVMVCGEKGFGLIASLLATWLGGGVLLTVDRRLPAARQQAMADVAGVSYLLYVGESRGQDAWMWGGLRFRAIGVDRDTGLIISGPAEAPTEPGPEGADSAQWPQLAPDDPAYIFFTSGTTGGPKGVLGCHKGLSHFLHWQREEFGISPQDRSAQLTGLSFDVVLRDILLPLTSGATLCLPGDDADVGAGRTLAWLSAERVTILHTVPAVAQAWLLNAPPGLQAHSLRKVFFAGEPLTGTLVNDWRQVCANQCEIVNLYGPTETTLAKCYYRVPPDGLPGRQPVGRPMPHTQVLILRGDDQLCGIGEVGEVVIRTPFRTLGYIGGPEEDRRRFVKNMFGDDDQDVLYRTGDLGSYRYDGDIELLGRIDQQVKIRGMRVELAEVEATLAEHPVVRQCAVVVREDERGDNSLAAYVAAVGDRAPSPAELRRYLQARLPEYMVPSAFVAIAELPLTANGKLDRKALPAVSPAVAVGGQGPRTPVEEILAGIWAEVLRRESVGVKENFFDLGGHSLLATQLVSRVREAFQVELPLRALFESPTVEGLAEAVECARHDGTRAEAPAILPVSRDRDLPLSYAQQRLWFIHQFAPESAAYNTSRLMRLRGPLNLSALRQGLREIQRRHEVLRTRFVSRDRRPVQVIDRPAEFSLPVWDLSKFEEDEREALARELVRREADRAFDLECGPVWRTALVRLGAEDHMLLLAIHHVASDAWSAGLLANELAALYRAMRAGERPALPELPIQYSDFAVWQRQWLRGEALAQQTAYWKKELEGAPHEVRLPTDRPKPWERSGLGAGCRQVIGPSLFEHVRRFNKQQSVTMFITLLAAFKIVLLKWCRQSDITVGTVIANRNRTETEKLIGCFMNFLPLRTRLGEEVRGIDLLAQIKSNVLEAYRHQDCPFEKIVEAINPGRSESLSPLYNVGFLLLNVPGAEMAGDGIQVEVVTQEVRRALLDVRMVVIERDAELEVLCEYSRDLFEEETIRWLLGSWQKVLEQLTGWPEQAVGSYRLAEELEGATETARSWEKAQEIAVAATFTADPVAETVAYWMEELGIGTRVRFAPYNQLHQQLLSEESALSNNRRGVNVALVRLEDWAGPGGGAVRELGRDNLERSVEEFITAARHLRKRSSVGLAVIICPASPDVKSASGELMTEMERRIEDGLGGEAGVTVVSSREVMRLYPVESYYDAHADELGHMPYTRAMYAGLGTMIARKAFSFLGEEYKAIALDCDGVLWKGTVGEDGTDGVEIDEGRRRLQEFMVRQQAAGRLLCLCSKNNEADVTEVFARPDMALRLDHLAARRVNWKPKSENLRSLAEELNIGLHQFIFIDDSEIECAEVEARCGDVLVLQLPEDGRRIPTWLDHVWAFDCTKPTDEDAKRTAFYQQNPERERVREEAMTLEDFLRGLALKVDFRPISEQQVTRVSQLTRRTSQFNNTGIELIEGEIERLIGEQGYSCEVLDVSDRFGEYGLVGAMIYRRQADALRVKTFLLSCRALGRSIEHQMLRRLQERAEAGGAGWVEIEYRETPRNLPARSFLDAVGHRTRLDGNTWSYQIKAIPDRDEAASRAAPAMELSGITSAE